MQWFRHDTSAAHDAKIRKLILRYGPIGYAVYFHCLELIAGDLNANNITFELEHDAEIIADNLKIRGTSELSSVDLVQEVMRYIISLDLFVEAEGRIFCFKLLKRLDSSMTSNPQMRQMIGQAKESHDTVMTPSAQNRIEENRIDNNKRFRANVFLKEFCSNEQLISDWLKVRKTKKAANTKTAMERFINQVEKSGLSCERVLQICCEKSWAGFNADWLEKTGDVVNLNDHRKLL